MFIAIDVGASPASCQARAWRQASDEAAFLRNRDELPWWHQPALRVTPADECFHAGDRAGYQIYLWLIIQRQFSALDRMAQTAFERSAFDGK